jgi:hypothetical protein
VLALATPGSGRRTTACTHENTAVLTPIPTDSDTITTHDTTGMCSNARQEWRRFKNMDTVSSKSQVGSHKSVASR